MTKSFPLPLYNAVFEILKFILKSMQDEKYAESHNYADSQNYADIAIITRNDRSS